MNSTKEGNGSVLFDTDLIQVGVIVGGCYDIFCIISNARMYIKHSSSTHRHHQLNKPIYLKQKKKKNTSYMGQAQPS